MAFSLPKPGVFGHGRGELELMVSIWVSVLKEPQVNGGENGALFRESPKDRAQWKPA